MIYEGQGFVPPPKTIKDIREILDQQPLADPQEAQQRRRDAAAQPPANADDETLTDFYWKRAAAAGKIGAVRQQIADLETAVQLSRRSPWQTRVRILWDLGAAETFAGSFVNSVRHREEALAMIPKDRLAWIMGRRESLTAFYAQRGKFEQAERLLDEAERSLSIARSWRTWGRHGSMWTGYYQWAKAEVLNKRGLYSEAEPLIRSALANFRRDLEINPTRVRGHLIIETMQSKLAMNLAQQGRLVAAEVEVRQVLLDVLARAGRYNQHTAGTIRYFASVIAAQGRYREAEQLIRAAIDIYQKLGVTEDAMLLADSRRKLTGILIKQGKWQEALDVFEVVRQSLVTDPETFDKGFSANLGWAIALTKVGRADEAVPIAAKAWKRKRNALGPEHPESMRARAILSAAHAVAGKREEALNGFRQSTPFLLRDRRAEEHEEEVVNVSDPYIQVALEMYIDLLADIHGTAVEQRAGIDAVAEAFRIADALHGMSVQRAFTASVARYVPGDPELADLTRRLQDAQKQISSLNALLAGALSQPTSQQDAETLSSLRGQIDQLRGASKTLLDTIDARFPEYAELMDPEPATIAKAQSLLKPDETLIVTHSGTDRTYVWAVPYSGEATFSVAPLGRRELADTVNGLRTALEPNASVVGDIPDFDIDTAYHLYQVLLAPHEATWRGAKSLFVVADGALGYLPFSLLPTKPARLAPPQELLFANYRAVPWLARTHAVTVLPSVAALGGLQLVPVEDAGRRHFIGFGDPYFNAQQALQADQADVAQVVTQRGASGVTVSLRRQPDTRNVDSATLGLLPRLADTRDEIQAIADILGADMDRDVFLGRDANERNIKTRDLSRYEVISIATHGLIPGDLNGLSQPALALSSPEVTGDGENDGLLTMGEILGLKLNADWVVLSACNTALGEGEGAEAVSGLGRAFFYAGSRALLVSNWPVHSAATTDLMTTLFKRQANDNTLSRTEALRQTRMELVDHGVFKTKDGSMAFSYAHPLFWAPFTVIGDGR